MSITGTDINVRAGKLDRRIVIKSPPSALDATGFTAATPNASTFAVWDTVATCFARIDPGSGNERRESAREINESPVMIFVRYGIGKLVTTKMWAQNRVTLELYDIRDVSQIEDGRRLTQLACRVVV